MMATWGGGGPSECCDGYRNMLKIIRVLCSRQGYAEDHQSAVMATGVR